ncbi:hypothetical protein LTR67_006442 [Exophiala xenobiotica]
MLAGLGGAQGSDVFRPWTGNDEQTRTPRLSSPFASRTTDPNEISLQITSAPHDLRRRQDLEITYLPGPYTVVEGVGSLCGYVTSDVHAPVYCGEGLYCFTSASYLQCCSEASESLTTTAYSYTQVSTGREGGTTTEILTGTPETLTPAYGSDCAPQTTACYNYNDTSSCTGDCTAAALLCTDSYFPYCASLYAPFSYSTMVGSSVSIGTSQVGITYSCDTAAYGLEYGMIGYWPSIRSTVTLSLTSTESGSSATFTPTVVPYSKTQASRPASSAAISTSTATSTGLSVWRNAPRSPVWVIWFWLGMTLLNVAMFLLYDYIYKSS